ncbi:MAG TPA: BTAD domain-containing putative transcriptional regulator [Streptosporangiaceae bacterium]|nr:BTAD domain-containing putative transcriptional regulator [Streptosporangiaceae bacterium]
MVVGGAGYGKSALAAESAEFLDMPVIAAVLESAGVSAALLPHRLRSGAARVGLSDLAARMDQAAPAGPAGVLDAMLEALAGSGAMIVLDEVQNAEPEALSLLTRLAGQLGAGQHLLLVGREAPSGIASLRRDSAVVWLGTADLAMTTPEVAALCRQGFGLTVSGAEAERLRAATGGWTAAVVLAASQSRSAGQPLLAGSTFGASGSPGDTQVLAGLVEQILRGIPEPVRQAVIQVAHLPLLHERIVARATGIADLLAVISHAGLPLNESDAGWFEFIGPVQHVLVARAPVATGVLTAAAAAYAEEDRPDLAAGLLIGAGRASDAAALLAAMSPLEAERLGLDELTELAGRLPADVLDEHARILLHISRECEPPAAIHRRAQALTRALGVLGEPPSDPELAREVKAELARDLVRDDDPEGAEALAAAVLGETPLAEERTRARLLDTLGRVAARYNDDKHLTIAADQLTMAARSYRNQGLWSWLAYTLVVLGCWVHAHRGAFDQAVAAVDEALEVIPNRRQQRAVILTFRAEILNQAARYEEAEASLAEAEAIAQVIGDVRVRAYVWWERARGLSQQDDGPGTLAAILAAESFRSDWFDGCGGEFLADAADWLDRVGYRDLALQYLDRARLQSEHEDFEVERATATIMARTGDPEEAERRLLALAASPWCEPVERWRVQLLRALAAGRRGDPAATALALGALELAARLGHPGLPLIIERRAATSLLGLVAGTGHPLATGLANMTFPVAVTLLGGFGLTRGGQAVDVPPGQGRQLVKLVATAGGRLTTEGAMEALWPEADPEASANRLRTVLNRLKDAAGDLIVREDRQLRLCPDVHTDVQAFTGDARRAMLLAAGGSREAVSAARAALARYGGDLLPDDPYEPWTELPRQRLRNQALALFDLCADWAARAGDLDEAVRCLERAIELAPDEEERYLNTARHLLTQGRGGAARRMVQRARTVVDELGVRPPVLLIRLEEQLSQRAMAV